MSSITGITSGKGSPGVSSLALGLAWALGRRSIPPLVIEADSSGGVVGQRLGLPPNPSLATMVRDARQGLSPEIIFRNTVEHEGVSILQAPVDPRAAEAAVDSFGRLLEESALDLDVPSLVDLGRCSFGRGWERAARSVDRILLVTTPRVEDVQSARFVLRRLAETQCLVGLVVVGAEPYPASDVAEALGVELLGSVESDQAVATALGGGQHQRSKFRKSLLARSIDGLASRLLEVSE